MAGAISLACTTPDEARPPHSAETRAAIESLSLSRLAPPPPSPDNRYADDLDAAVLGHRLFFDRRLSADGRIACASCHQPDYWFTEPRPTARGLRPLPRRTPTLVGAAWLPFLHWDGREDGLWSQALAPLESPDEHGASRRDVARVIAAHHREPYEAVFGPLLDPDAADDASIDAIFMNAGRALEAYVRRLQPAPAPFDRFVDALREGDPRGGGHLTAAAERGLHAFIGPAGCLHCHHGPLLTDRAFHNLGLPPAIGVPDDDPGRALGARRALEAPFRCGGPHSETTDCPELRFLDPEAEGLLGAFKTPSLRNVAARPPYMHGGHFEDLAAVLSFYRTLPGEAAIGRRAAVLHQMDRGVSAEDLEAFLESLTGSPPDLRWRTPPPDLP
jgi:cytochrome c peroxidase